MIKLFLADCDGTLTNGMYYMSEKGSWKMPELGEGSYAPGKISKSFFTRDFHGLWMLNKAEVKVGVVTYANDGVIEEQCKRVGGKYVHVMSGVKDKRIAVEEEYVQQGIPWDEIAFIGDDVFDLPLLEAVGIACCPSDAHKKVIDAVQKMTDGVVADDPGGHGAVRWFADYLLDFFTLPGGPRGGSKY